MQREGRHYSRPTMAWTWASQVQQTAGVVQSIRAAFFFSQHTLRKTRDGGHSEVIEARPASVEKSASLFPRAPSGLHRGQRR